MTDTLPYNFGALSPELAAWQDARVVILPVPYDATSNINPGSRHGPSAAILQSRNMELFDEELMMDVASTLGICTLEELSPDLRGPEFMMARCLEAARAVVEADKLLVTLGGEGSVALGPIKALHERYPSMSVLHMDAHLDLHPEMNGASFHHMCVMYQVNRVMGVHVVQVGARSFSQEEHSYLDQAGMRPYYARDAVGRYDFVDRLVDDLHDEVYVSFDLSAFDPSVCPATPRPEPGGMDWYLATHILRRVGEKRRIVGADINEHLPIPGHPASDMLVAKLAYKLAGYSLLLR